MSNRQIAAGLGVSPTTVGAIRNNLEESGTVSKLDTIIGKDGVSQPARKPIRTRFVDNSPDGKKEAVSRSPRRGRTRMSLFRVGVTPQRRNRRPDSTPRRAEDIKRRAGIITVAERQAELPQAGMADEKMLAAPSVTASPVLKDPLQIPRAPDNTPVCR